jgi:hypothetical protein
MRRPSPALSLDTFSPCGTNPPSAYSASSPANGDPAKVDLFGPSLAMKETVAYLPFASYPKGEINDRNEDDSR